MRVLICGGRDLNVSSVRDYLIKNYSDKDITEVIEGEATGADLGARYFAICKMIPFKPFPANWAKYGKKAGPIRNKQMLDEGNPDYVIAFPGGKGTTNMIEQALLRGLRVERITNYEEF